MADSTSTHIRKLQLQEEILSTYGVRIPGPLLAGLTPVNLSDIKNIFFDAMQRAGANSARQPDPQHPRPAAPVRTQGQTETQDDRTREVTGHKRQRHEHIVFGANTPSGQTICHCAIGADHGPIVGLGGATHA